MPHPTASLLYISRTVWARITKFYRQIHTDLPYPIFPPDLMSLTTSGWKLPRKNRRICRLRHLHVEFLEKGLSEDHQISQGCRGQLPDMTSLITSGLLQNAIKYCTKLMCKTGPVGQRVEYVSHSLTYSRLVWRGHPWRLTLHPYLIWPHQLLPIAIYRSSQNGRKCRFQRFGSNFSGAVFCLPHQLVGFLLYSA